MATTTARSRPQFERSAQNVRRLLAVADRRLTEPRERAILARLQSSFDAFMALDVVAYRALQAGQERRVKRIFLGPEIRNFEAMAAAASQLAAEEGRRNARGAARVRPAPERCEEDARGRRSRRRAC